MQCVETWAGSSENLKRFTSNAAGQRIPLNGSVALTHRCNLHCEHCFTSCQKQGTGEHELTGLEWCRILDECAGEGCLSLLITGGEPLIRDDFADIYRHAKEIGMRVCVFTNATLVTGRLMGLFADLPPQAVEVSIYGGTEATHDKITGVPGSFERAIRGVEMLIEGDVRVRLKTMLMSSNKEELESMGGLAASYGLDFKFDSLVFPRLNGDSLPLEYRLSADEVVAADLNSVGMRTNWRDFFERQRGTSETDRVYVCGAGVLNFHVSPTGSLQPCQLARSVAHSLRGRRFGDVWRQVVQDIEDKKTDTGCRSCEKKSLCGYCPAFFELETGSETTRSEFLCEVGHKRYDQLFGTVHVEGVANETAKAVAMQTAV